MSLLERLEAIKAIRDLEQYDEAGAKHALVLSLLKELGWDPFNREEVYPEYPLDEKKLDYCLQIEGNVKVFIEAKKPSENLERHEEQLLQYAYKRGVKLAILTNGVTWWFYLAMKEVPWPERKFFAIDIRTQSTSEISSNFLSFLGKQEVASGEAIESAEKLLESKSRVRKIQQTLPRAWREIIGTPDDLLVEIVADKVDSLCGHKPEEQIVVSFLRKIEESSKTEPTIIRKTPPVISIPIGKTEYADLALVMNYRNSHARAMYNGRRVVVLSGSKIMAETHKSLRDKDRELRERLRGEGTLVEDDTKGLLTLKKDVGFNSPSGAACFVAGCSVSGNRDWHIEDTDTPLGSWLKSDRGGNST